MINVKGEYCIIIPFQSMFMNEKLVIKRTNLITTQGVCFFMNRWINNEFDVIKYIVLGKANNRPLKSNKKLGKETVRKLCVSKTNPKTKKLCLSCDVTASEILDTCEIGTANDEILISRDIYEKISSTFLGDSTSSVHIDYCFTLQTGSLRSNWKHVSGTNYYHVYEPNMVVGVFELNSNSGYKQVDSKEALVQGSYFYDVKSRNVYVRCIGNVDPDNIELIVQTK